MSCPFALGTFACHLCVLLCARSVCSARARVPDMYNNATVGLGVALIRGGGYLGGDHSLGPAGPHVTRSLGASWGSVTKNLLPQLEATSRFCPDELCEAFANHFSRGQIAEMAARLEDAWLAMEADDPPATQTRDPGSQRQAGPLARKGTWSTVR